jgi:hypothetical protein
LFSVVVSELGAARVEPIAGQPLEELGKALPPPARFFFERSLELRRQAPRIDFGLHALQRSA